MEKKYEGIILYRFKQDISSEYQKLLNLFSQDSTFFFEKATEIRNLVQEINEGKLSFATEFVGIREKKSKANLLLFLNSIIDNRFSDELFIEEVAFMEIRRVYGVDSSDWGVSSDVVLLRDSILADSKYLRKVADSLLFDKHQIQNYESLLEKKQSPYNRVRKIPANIVKELFESITPKSDDKAGIRLKIYLSMSKDAVYYIRPI